MSIPNIKMFAPAGFGGSLLTANSGTVFVQSDGTVTVSALDANDLIKLGFQFAVVQHGVYAPPAAPAAASQAATVTSVSLSAGSTSLTIAAQPDLPRQLQALVSCGSPALSGVLQMTYVANDGTTVVDSLAFTSAGTLAAGQIGATLATSKAVEKLVSAIALGITGGSSQGIQIGTNTSLGIPVSPRFVDFAVTKESRITVAGTVNSSSVATSLITAADEAVGTVNAAGAMIIPTGVAPDGTHLFSFSYNQTLPA